MAPRHNPNRRRNNGGFGPKRNSAPKRRFTKKKNRKSSTNGGYLATGIRTLTSFLPGQKIVRPAVDMVLKAIGLVTAINLHQNTLYAETQIIGLTTSKALYYGDLLSNCRNIGLQDLDNKGNPTLQLNFQTGRIISMKIHIEPTTKAAERSGEWAACFSPLKDASTKQAFAAKFPQFEEIKNMPYAKYGMASNPLSINWVPRFPRDGSAAMERNLQSQDAVGYVYLAYSQDAREAYTNVPPEVFNFRTTITTRCQLGERIINTTFSQGNNSIKLRCDVEVPKSSYLLSYRGRCIEIGDADFVEDDSKVKIAIPPTHADYESLLEDYTLKMAI